MTLSFIYFLTNLCHNNKILESDFVVTICDISDELFKKLKNYGEK